jgi:hypothetical protein
MTWLIDYINILTKQRFYGKITLSFEAGKLVNVQKVENIKPPS